METATKHSPTTPHCAGKLGPRTGGFWPMLAIAQHTQANFDPNFFIFNQHWSLLAEVWPVLENTWSMPVNLGRHLARTDLCWSSLVRSAPHLGQMWPKHGPNLAKAWPRSGPHLTARDPIWSVLVVLQF